MASIRPRDLSRFSIAEAARARVATYLYKVYASDDGLLSGIAGIDVIPVINMVEGDERRGEATAAARTALASTDRFDRVILSSMRDAAEPIVAAAKRRSVPAGVVHTTSASFSRVRLYPSHSIKVIPGATFHANRPVSTIVILDTQFVNA